MLALSLVFAAFWCVPCRPAPQMALPAVGTATAMIWRGLVGAACVALIVRGRGLFPRNRRLLLALAGWTALNILLAWGAAGLTEAAGIAWEAHLGGFYMGLLTYGWFDRAQPIEPPAEDDIADAG